MNQLFRSIGPAEGGPSFGTFLLLGLASVAASCADDDDPVSQNRTPTIPVYSPSTGQIPIPNDLVFSDTLDLTLNIPLGEVPSAADAPLIAINQLDGWSTTAPIVFPFTRPIDDATVDGTSVRLFKVSTVFSLDPMSMAGFVPVAGPVTGIESELVEGTDFTAEIDLDYPGGSAIRITPLVPLEPSTFDLLSPTNSNTVYMAVVTKDVTDTEGFAIGEDLEYFFASEPTPIATAPPTLMALQTLVNAQLAAYEAFTADSRDNVAVSLTFTTQSTTPTLDAVSAIASGGEAALLGLQAANPLLDTSAGTAADPFSAAAVVVNNAAPSIGTASALLGGPAGIADIYTGVFSAPYYLTAAANSSFNGLTTDDAPLTNPWRARFPFADVEVAPGVFVSDEERNLTRFNPVPGATACEKMPMLISVPQNLGTTPENTRPTNGWPVVIFQHGVFRNRGDLLGVAEALAAEGLAAVAIDLPLHGVGPSELLPNGTPIFAGHDQTGQLRERTFGLDLLSNDLANPGPTDGIADTSGIHYVNFSDLVVTRDNLRQAVADLINLRASLGDLDIAGDTDVFDETQVHFMGYSLGGIIGSTYIGVDNANLTAATLAMPGASLPYLFNGSAAFGGTVESGLAAFGISPNTPDYSNFLAAAQTAVDSADPINYAAAAGASALPIYLIEIVGGGALGGFPDFVVPNSVPGAPLAGTEPLITALGLDSFSTTPPTAAGGLKGAVRITEGSHSSLISNGLDISNPPPAGFAEAFNEIQAQFRSFHGSDGTDLTITDTSVVQ